MVQILGDGIFLIFLGDLIESNEFFLVKENLLVVGEVTGELHMVDLIIGLFDGFVGFGSGGKEGFL